MKELDRDIIELNKKIERLESQIRENSTKINQLTYMYESSSTTRMDDGDANINLESIEKDTSKLMTERQSIVLKVTQKLAEKKSIALTMIENFTQYENKLDADLVTFEQDLKQSGEYEAPRGLPPNTEVTKVSVYYSILQLLSNIL